MPYNLKRVADIIGWEASWTLIQQYGGLRLRIPRELGHGDVLSLLIGQDAARRLVESELAGVILHIPMSKKWIAQLRDHHIRHSDQPARELARMWNVTQRWVYRIRGENRQQLQDALF